MGGVLLATGLALAAPPSKLTHLGVPPNQVVNAVTAVVPNNNTGGHVFRHDISGPNFTVPEKMVFVVTDIFIRPEPVAGAASDVFLVVVNLGPTGSRIFTAQFTGVGQFYQSLGGGMVIPGGTTPTARNTTTSPRGVVVQMLGYLVDGEAIPENTSPF
jgi:hypothetical protein